MREIKFRAWDRKTNGWQWFSLSFILQAPAQAIYNVIGGDRFDKKSIGQWTGLLDCKGNLIYEGDIVHRFIIRPSYEVPEIEQVFEVFWDTSYAGFSVRSTSGWEPIFKVIVDSDCEVIGNIYENPELLK